MDDYMSGSFDANHDMGYHPFMIAGIKNKFRYSLGYLLQKFPLKCSSNNPINLTDRMIFPSLRERKSLIKKIEEDKDEN